MRGNPIIVVLFVFFIILSSALLLVSQKLALAVFAGGLVVVVIFFRPFWGLLLYLAMLYLRPQEFIPALRAQPLMLALAFVVLGTLIVHNVLMKRPFVMLSIRQSLYLLVFFALIPLSQLQRFYLTGAQDAFMDFLPKFLLFFMITNLVKDFEQLKKAFGLLFFMTLFLAANGILQYWRGTDIAGQTAFMGRIRWIGIFEDPNDLGLTILAFTPFAIMSVLSRGASVFRRALWTAAASILIYALFLTNSRGTFLGLLAVFAWLFIRRWGLMRGALLAAAAAAVLFIAGPSRFAEMSADEASASGRIDAWATGLNLLKWRPILGVGYGSFTEYHQLTAHNSVVLCMSELGLTGLYVWLLFIVSGFEEMIIVQRRSIGTRFAFYAEAMQLSLIGFFTAAFFLSRTYNEVLYILVALAALLSFLSRRQFGYGVSTLSRATLVRTFAFMVFLIVLVKVIVML
jgi:hypothetical protein